MGRWLVVLACWVAQAAQGAPPLLYDPSPPRIQSVSSQAADSVRRAVELDPDEGPELVLIDGQEPTLAALVAVHACSLPWSRGRELDLLVSIAEVVHPVTLWFDRRGGVSVAVGHQLPAMPKPFSGGKAQWADILRERWGVVELKEDGAQWTRHEVALIDGAMRLLSASERQVLRGVSLIRQPVDPQTGNVNRQALYVSEGATVSVRVFNSAFPVLRAGFVGSLDRPYPSSFMPLIHEMGHAVAMWPIVQASAHYERAFARYETAVPGPAQIPFVAKVQQAQSTLEDVIRQDPVLSAFAKARGKVKGPTPYGRSSNIESFAEAFALYRLDPQALARVMPEVHAWFERGGHLKAAGLGAD